MYSILVISLSFIIPIFLVLVTLYICKESSLNRNKPSPFECGFEAFSTARIMFSLKFYFIVIIFLIFDAEIALMLPLPISNMMNDFYPWLFSIFSLTLVLILGLFIEWKQGALSWSYLQ